MKTLSEIQSPLYERSGTRNRIRDISVLAAFTVMVAVTATVVMDLIIYPICLFALHRTETFNIFIRYGSLIIISLLFIALFARAVYRYIRTGLSARGILFHLLRGPLSIIVVGLFLILLSALITGLLYGLLYGNNRLIHYLMSN